MYKIICLFLINLTAYGFGPFTIRFSPADLSFSKNSGYDRVKASGYFSTLESGAPELPAKYLNYILPPANQADSIVIISETVQELPGEYLIYPVQADSDRKANRFTTPDSTIYQSARPYPTAPLRLTQKGGMDGAEISGLAFYPLRYYPKEKKLVAITEVTFEFHLEHKKELVHPKIRSENLQRIYDAAMKKVVENDADILLCYQRPSSKPQREFSKGFQLIDCLIICPQNQVTAYEPLRLWLTQTGDPTVIWTIEDILT